MRLIARFAGSEVQSGGDSGGDSWVHIIEEAKLSWCGYNIFKLDIGMVKRWGNRITNDSWIRDPIYSASRAYSPTNIRDSYHAGFSPLPGQQTF